MMKSVNRPKFAETAKPGAARYINTALMTLSIPFVTLGFIYLVVFFLLNSSYGPKILHGQLSSFLRGDFSCDRMSTDAFLQTLTMTKVRVAEAGKSESIVFASKVEAKIPLAELAHLASSTLLIGRIKVYDADVTLDFTRGELNILKAVIPYKSKPEPPTPPGNFSVFLSDMNVENSRVHLVFDGFRIDMSGTEVDHYSLRTGGGILEMKAPSASSNGGRKAIRVQNGNIRFNPAMFSFALASVGDADEGLIMSGGPGSAGKIGYANAMMTRHISEMLRTDAELGMKLGPAPDMRGDFIIELHNIQVDGINWLKNTFEIPAMDTGLGETGRVSLRNAMMNVGPTQDDIDAHAQKYQHRPSGLLPQESLLWAADLDLTIDADDDILAYFFGSLLSGRQPINLHASMAGDLARVSGDIALDAADLTVADTIDMDRLALRARMDGQHVDIHALEADTIVGGAAASGYYEIMDGNFDVDLFAGKKPGDDYQYIDPAFADRLDEGISPLDMLPDGSIKRFSGMLSAHLKAASKDGMISVILPEPIEYKLDEAFAGVRKIHIDPEGGDKKTILTLKDSIIASPAGLDIDWGNDNIEIKPGFKANLANLDKIDAAVKAHIEKPALYAEVFGLSDLSMGPLDIEASYRDCSGKACGGLRIQTENLSYMGIGVPKVNVVMDLDESNLRTKNFLVQTDFAKLTANIGGGFSLAAMRRPERIPFNAIFALKDVDLSKLHLEFLKPFGLKGQGEGTLEVRGPIEKLDANLRYTMHDLEAMGVPVARLSVRARYEDNLVYVPGISVWFTKAEITEEEAARLDALEKETAAENADSAKGRESSAPPSATAAPPSSSAMAEAGSANPNQTANASVARRPYTRSKDGSIRRRADFSINTITYDPAANTVSFNTWLNPISPNAFKAFRDLDIPAEGKLSFDLTGNADLNAMMGDVSAKNAKKFKSTWIEGNIKLEDAKYDRFSLGTTEIELSRSQQFALIRGTIADIFDLSGFVRISPNLTISASLNFPDLDVLKTLNDVGLGADVAGILEKFALHKAILSGSVGFCMKSISDMKVSLIMDDLLIDVYGSDLTLSSPLFLSANLAEQSVSLQSLELKYRDSVLKLRGDGDINGNVDVDVNGEIDAAIARSVVPAVSKATGLMGISLSAKGNLFSQNVISLKNIDVSGYIGVRDPIQLQTSMTESPVELKKGFFVIDRQNAKCGKTLCLYTPEDQKFTLGVNDQWLELDFLASMKGDAEANIGGVINAAIAQLFVKDISAASGTLDLNASAKGKFLDRNGAFDVDLNKFDFSAKAEVTDPIRIELRSMNDPVTVDDGILLVTEGADCPSRGECAVIPKNRPFHGELMGGSYRIFGDVSRDALTPKRASLNVTANNVGFRMKDELSVTVSPDIQIKAKDLADFDTMTVSGDIDIIEARYKKNFDDGSSNFIRDQLISLFVDSKRRVEAYSPSFLRKMPQVGKIHLDIGASAENSISADVQIAGANVELEVGTQLRIGGTIKEFYPTGIVSISSGVFGFRDNEFEVQNGAQIAFNGSLDGKIDLTASTEINTDSSAFSSVANSTDLDRRKRISTSSASSNNMYSITLTVGGTVFRPLWSFDSTPYLTDTNIYALVLTGRTIEDFSGNDVAMESLLSPLFSSQLDTIINADQFKFVFSEGAAQFVYVKQINKALRVAAGLSIRGAEGNEQALSAEYFFNDRWYVDLTGQNTSDEAGRAPTFKLGARLHWHLPIE